jgi:hypothetical protein
MVYMLVKFVGITGLILSNSFVRFMYRSSCLQYLFIYFISLVSRGVYLRQLVSHVLGGGGGKREVTANVNICVGSGIGGIPW